MPVDRNHPIFQALQNSVTISEEKRTIFFKTAPGSYGEHDLFLGIATPALRKIAEHYKFLSLDDLQTLIESAYNEERLLALFILIKHYQANKMDDMAKNQIVSFYIYNMKHINNWNLVDASAHLILGAHLHTKDKSYLLQLVSSAQMWERRIAIVATWYFIKEQDLEWTFKIATLLSNDKHDLIHKATGWMLREAGKKDQNQLITFLNEHAAHMPRTMLRYAIEKFDDDQKSVFLKKRA